MSKGFIFVFIYLTVWAPQLVFLYMNQSYWISHYQFFLGYNFYVHPLQPHFLMLDCLFSRVEPKSLQLVLSYHRHACHCIIVLFLPNCQQTVKIYTVGISQSEVTNIPLLPLLQIHAQSMVSSLQVLNLTISYQDITKVYKLFRLQGQCS